MDGNDMDLMEQFIRIQWLLHRYNQQNFMNHGPIGNPRRGQGRVLAILKMKPEITQKDLSYLLDMRPQSLGELLSKLEKKGYITRTPSEKDRRVINIKLTEEGKQATVEELDFRNLFQCLNEEEQNNLNVYLQRIIKSLEEELGDIDEHDVHMHGHRGNPFHNHFGRPGRGGNPLGGLGHGGNPFGGHENKENTFHNYFAGHEHGGNPFEGHGENPSNKHSAGNGDDNHDETMKQEQKNGKKFPFAGGFFGNQGDQKKDYDHRAFDSDPQNEISFHEEDKINEEHTKLQDSQKDKKED